MYVCMYVRTYVRMYVCMYVYLNIYIYLFMWILEIKELSLKPTKSDLNMLVGFAFVL